ncbi:MAG TPA: sugar ABC transporter ATP-binding protein [Candidatus Aminicenantes bacterium]|nr:sugar ABC transporter ATP-binding protein [Candidatus Aminicenantes bacterium]HRY65693.1 sugar ABC transporter ATP-binding protein [Candidatus Aminicenantes bacterium]HRZ72607.1 sugar ABC transporter ATP-binding protein [Candidatus Aminicenantes bacterium]
MNGQTAGTNLPPPVVAMTGIRKEFAGVPVLKDVEWELRPGEVHILAGENGAGKSTLIKILAGVHTDYEGEIRLAGRRVRFRRPHDAARLGIAAIHQDIAVVPSLSVRDNIFLGREIVRRRGWVRFGPERARARKILDRLGLDLDVSRPLGDFPVSVRQLVEIAKALVNEARVIIMDEPTSALNETEAGRLFEIIRGLKSQGCAVVFISHRLEEIYRIGDRITVLRDGRFIGTFAAADLGPERLIEQMVGRELGGLFPPREARSGELLLRAEGISVPDPGGVRPWAVEDLSFDLREGEILGVAGLRGSGNSELFHGLFGACGGRVRGRIRLAGKEYVPRSPGQALRRGLALLTNDRKASGLVPTMSVGRNISLASLEALSPGGWIRERREAESARRHIGALGIKVRSAEQDILTLSGGNQQKVLLARWIETSPKVLLLDEPTIGIDVGAKNEIYRLLNAWTSAGKGILLITSELPELLALSDRILVLHRGRLMGEFDRREATQELIIAAAMGKEKRS